MTRPDDTESDRMIIFFTHYHHMQKTMIHIHHTSNMGFDVQMGNKKNRNKSL